jgi:hypothetical protein
MSDLHNREWHELVELAAGQRIEIERMTAIETAAIALSKEVETWAEDAGGYAPAWFELEKALKGKK